MLSPLSTLHFIRRTQDHLQFKMTRTTRLTIYSTDFSAGLEVRFIIGQIPHGSETPIAMYLDSTRKTSGKGRSVGERKTSPHPHNVSGACRRWWCVSHGWTQTETPQTRHRVSPSLSLPGAYRCLFLNRPRRRPFRASGDAACPLPLFRHPNTSGSRRQNPPPGSAGVSQSPCPIVGTNRTWPATTTGFSPYWSHNEPDCSCGIKKFVLGLNHPRQPSPLPATFYPSFRLLRGLHPPLRPPPFHPRQPSPAARIMSLN